MIDTIEHGPIRELRLNRPPVNALDPGLMAAIRDSVRKAADDGCRAIVISGGEGIFSAGLDVPVLLGLDRHEMREAIEINFETIETLAVCPIPIAAAVTGHSPAGGAVVSMFCDWRVMADGEFEYGFKEVAVGVAMPSIFHAAISYAVGPRYAEQLCVSGRLMGPREALAMGLLDRVVVPDEVVSCAVEYCRELVALPQRAMTQTRTMARKDLVEYVRQYRKRDADLFFTQWMMPETQRTLHELVERLKGNRQRPIRTSMGKR